MSHPKQVRVATSGSGSGREWTAAMSEAIQLCTDPREYRCLQLIITVLTGQGIIASQRQYEHVSWLLGLAGQRVEYVQTMAATARHIGCPEADITASFNFFTRLMQARGASVGLSELRELMRRIVDARKAKASPTVTVSNAPVTTNSRPRDSGHRPSFDLLRRCQDDLQSSFMRRFLVALSGLSAQEQDAVWFLAGVDADGLVAPRNSGAFVAARSKFKTAAAAEAFQHSIWDKITAVDPELTQRALNAHLLNMRLGRPTPVMVKRVADRVEQPSGSREENHDAVRNEVVSNAQPVPTVTTAVEKPVTSSRSFPGYEEILRRCTDKYRSMVEVFLDALSRAEEEDRRQMEALLALRDGSQPMTHAEYGPTIGINEGACSQRTSSIMHRLHANGLRADITVGQLRSITSSIRGVRRRGTLYLADAIQAEPRAGIGQSANGIPAAPSAGSSVPPSAVEEAGVVATPAAQPSEAMDRNSNNGPETGGDKADQADQERQPVQTAQLPSATYEGHAQAAGISAGTDTQPTLANEHDRESMQRPRRRETWPEAINNLSVNRRFLIWLGNRPIREQAVVRAFYFGITGGLPNTLADIATIFELPGGQEEARQILTQVRVKFQNSRHGRH